MFTDGASNRVWQHSGPVPGRDVRKLKVAAQGGAVTAKPLPLAPFTIFQCHVLNVRGRGELSVTHEPLTLLSV